MHLGAVRQQGIGDHNKLAPGANSPIPRSIRRSRPTAIRSGLGRSRREARLTVGERLVGIECRVRRTALVSRPAVHWTFPTRDSSQQFTSSIRDADKHVGWHDFPRSCQALLNAFSKSNSDHARTQFAHAVRLVDSIFSIASHTSVGIEIISLAFFFGSPEESILGSPGQFPKTETRAEKATHPLLGVFSVVSGCSVAASWLPPSG